MQIGQNVTINGETGKVEHIFCWGDAIPRIAVIRFHNPERLVKIAEKDIYPGWEANVVDSMQGIGGIEVK